MTEQQTPEDVPEDITVETTNPYTAAEIVDGVGIQDDEATELDQEVGA